MIKHNYKLNNEEGFSIIEILVAILVLVGFMLVTLQAMVFSALVMVKSQEKTAVLNWIEQDLEKIRYESLILGYDSAVCTTETYGTELLAALTGTYPTDVAIGEKDYRVYRDETPVGNTLDIEYVVAYDTTHPRYNSSDPYDENVAPTDSNTNFVASLSTTEMPNVVLICP